MNKYKKIPSLIFIVLIFVSCDCLIRVQGTVIDMETKLPIDKVSISVIKKTHIIYTDSLGNFELTSMSGGLFGCPNIVVSFEKEGYKKVSKKI
ncbi:MAG: carboxypeptidase-like regulatory domain-containing protein [Bacteroidales bacterium]|jgi:hypothetical protein|nr:carboxypeptidase-like regulatory domain-containing protein [Bacteroidales bacterium]